VNTAGPPTGGQQGTIPNLAARLVLGIVVVVVVFAIREAYKSSSASEHSHYQPTYSTSTNSPSHEPPTSYSPNNELTQPTPTPTPVAPPEVPALLAGEVPPRDLPNYFDLRELGSTAVAVYTACLDTIAQARSDVDPTARDAYCLCLSDASRLNARAGRESVLPTDEQSSSCVAYAQRPTGGSPFARTLPVPTAKIIEVLTSCLNDVPATTSRTYGVRVCSCTIDAILKSGTAASEPDVERCSIAARYSESTGINLTRRQFAALRVTTARAGK
jgi:hypothetical protein